MSKAGAKALARLRAELGDRGLAEFKAKLAADSQRGAADAQAAWRQAADRLETLGIAMPRTVEEWETLALAAESIHLPLERVAVGDFTAGEVVALVEAWHQRERWRRRLDAPPPSAMTTTQRLIVETVRKLGATAEAPAKKRQIAEAMGYRNPESLDKPLAELARAKQLNSRVGRGTPGYWPA